jgi:hypothetical protein
MKKVYIAPQTEAIQLLGESAIMVGSTKFIQVNAETVGGVYGD